MILYLANIYIITRLFLINYIRIEIIQYYLLRFSCILLTNVERCVILNPRVAKRYLRREEAMVHKETKLLVVDDEAMANMHLKSYFEKRGYAVFTATCAEEALPLIKKENPEIMLLDIGLPGMNGIELLQEVRKSNRALKVILISGYYNLDFPDATIKELNIYECVHKPIGLVELDQIVKKVLSKT